MKKFLIKGFLFSIPLIIIFVIVYRIDPYNLYHKDRTFNQTLYDIGYSFDQGRRYKIISYLNNPKPYIILGASEINLIHERNIPEYGWHSLSFGGAPLQESVDVFWSIVKSHQIEKIILAPEFIKFYNDCLGDFYSWNSSQSSKAYDLYANKLDYLVDKNVIRSSFYYLLSAFGAVNNKNKPKMTKEEFWQHQLSYAEGQFSQVVPDDLFDKTIQKLKDIASYCFENNIDIVVVIPIQHIDLIKIEFDDVAYSTYKKYLTSLQEIFGKVYFFDFPNHLSQDSDKFTDPFHFIDEAVYLDALWNDNLSNCIILEEDDDLNIIDKIRKQIIQRNYE